MATLSDTVPEMERAQIELIRKASPARRLDLALSLSQTAIDLSRRAIARASPSLDDREVRLKFVELHYGQDLANGVRRHLRDAQRPTG